jgi:hypothetical protein
MGSYNTPAFLMFISREGSSNECSDPVEEQFALLLVRLNMRTRTTTLISKAIPTFEMLLLSVRSSRLTLMESRCREYGEVCNALFCCG